MDTRILLICLATGFLALVGIIYGTKFLRAKNHMLGYEWYILAISAINAILYFSGIWETGGYISDFLDKFSKLAGISVIASLGMLKAVNGFSLHPAKEFALFFVGMVITALFMFEPNLYKLVPHVTFATSSLFTATLIFLAWTCSRRSLHGHVWAVIAIILVNIPITFIQDFVVLPNEQTSNFVNKFFLENIVWGVSFAYMYYLYRALENSAESYPTVRAPAQARAQG